MMGSVENEGAPAVQSDVDDATAAPGQRVSHYTFEGAAGSKPPRREDLKDRAALRERLGLTPAEAKTIEPKLNDFITHHHANIDWYSKAIKRELRLRRAYFVIIMILLAVIPLGIFGITSGNLMIAKFDPNITAAVTAGLAGLFAFHRGATAWLDKRQLVALYAKTNAQLKAAVYKFEQTWKKSRRGTKTIAELGMALEDATAAALAIVSAEQDAHYDIEAAPTFGLSDMLNSGSSAALTEGIAARETQEDKVRRELERSIRKLDARADRLTEMIATAHAELKGKQGDDRKSTVEELNSLIAKRQSTELEQAIAVTKLKSLRGVRP